MNPTGSSLPLLRKCQWWARPEVIAPPPQPPTEAMFLGTEVHAAIEAALLGAAPGKLSADAYELFSVWVDWWPNNPFGQHLWKPEVAFAYNPKTDAARQIDAKARAYSIEPDEIPGTIDAVAISGDSAIVIDWKTGADFANLTADASENWQLRLYALCVARAHKVDSVKIVIARITPWGVKTTDYTLDAIELDAVAAEVAALVASIPASAPKAGMHCRRCKAISACPTTTTAMEQVKQAVEVKIQNAEQASAALVRLRQVQAACEQMETMLKAWASENGGVSLPNGRKWTKVPMERETISLAGDNMAAGLAGIASAEALDAVETKATTSRAAIERVLKAKGLKGKELRAKMDALMEDLRGAGVLKTTVIEAWREVE